MLKTKALILARIGRLSIFVEIKQEAEGHRGRSVPLCTRLFLAIRLRGLSGISHPRVFSNIVKSNPIIQKLNVNALSEKLGSAG
jgi:hypothetical protein